jgi:flagellar biosynthesis/type III secretory pathway protein FliH
MVKTRSSLLPGRKKYTENKAKEKAAAISKATSAFNERWNEMAENKKQNLLDAGYNKDRLLKGYINDSGANGFKSMMTNPDNYNKIAFDVISSNIKKWLSSFKPS